MAESGEDSEKPGVTVVIAMDGSEYSSYALDFYAECLHRTENKVVIAHVSDFRCISHPAVAVMSGSTDFSLITKEIEAEELRSTELVERLTERMKHLKIDGSIARTHGDPGPALVTLCNENNASYIVVGCRGKSLVRKTFTGSVTDYVTHHSHVPVVVARHKDHMQHHGLHLHIKHSKKHDEKDPKSPTSPTSSKEKSK